MSTNKKNDYCPAFLSSFTKDKERRNIVVENARILCEYQEITKHVVDLTNKIVQELNVKIPDRQVPYVGLSAKKETELTDKSRALLLSDENAQTGFTERILAHIRVNGLPLSHIVGILPAPGCKKIVESPEEWGNEIPTEIVINRKLFLDCTLTDMLLDISMFNSYSFLKGGTLEDKQTFSFKKYRYFQDRSLPCFFDYRNGSKKLYYSFAFSARCAENRFNVDEYIQLWNDFINSAYPTSIHEGWSVEEQLKNHEEFHNLSLGKILRKLERLDAGAYLLLRINRTGGTRDLHPFIRSLFKTKNVEIGKVQIVPIDMLKRGSKFERILQNRDVSAFKIIKRE